jgi:serine/threonine protein kinase
MKGEKFSSSFSFFLLSFSLFLFLSFFLSPSHHFRYSFPADIFSLGVVLYVLIMKEFPFQPFQLTLPDPPHPKSIPLSFSKDIGELIMKMLDFVFCSFFLSLFSFSFFLFFFSFFLFLLFSLSVFYFHFPVFSLLFLFFPSFFFFILYSSFLESIESTNMC